jgi:hypothetical protein
VIEFDSMVFSSSVLMEWNWDVVGKHPRCDEAEVGSAVRSILFLL